MFHYMFTFKINIYPYIVILYLANIYSDLAAFLMLVT